jgi:hypothetical protein
MQNVYTILYRQERAMATPKERSIYEENYRKEIGGN